jgi:hypothetical protein
MPLPTGLALFQRLAVLESRRRQAVSIRAIGRRKRTLRRRRQARFWERWRNREKKRAHGRPFLWAPLPNSQPSRMAAAMVPGEWYGRMDLVRLIGVPREKERDLRGVVNVLLARGWVERERNPNWPGPGPVAKDEGEPEWLYRLTRVGEEARDRLGVNKAYDQSGEDHRGE